MNKDSTLDRFLKESESSTESNNSELDPKVLTGVSDEWKKTPLAEVADDRENSFVDGPFGANLLSEEYYDEGFARTIKLQNIRSGRFINTNKKYVSEEKFKELERHSAYPTEIAIAKMAKPVARACILPDFENQYILAAADVVKLDTGENFSNVFVMYSLNSYPVWKQAFSRSRGTGRKRINLNQLKEVQIPTPPLLEQRKIATVLYTVDRAIEKSKEIETQLERTQKGLIQDFLAHGLQGLETKDTATKLGEIPSHWDVVTIENILSDDDYSFTDGARYSLSSDEIRENGDARAILLEEVKEGEFDDSNPKFATGEKYKEITHRAIYPGEVVVAKMAEPVARACIVPDTYEKYLLGCADVVRIVPNEEIEDRFLMYCMNSHKVWRQAVAHLRGTGRSRINLENISELYIPKPPLSEQREIVSVLSGIDQQIDNEQQYRNNLQRLKLGLQQDLLSGTVRTTDTNIEVPDEIAQHG